MRRQSSLMANVLAAALALTAQAAKDSTPELVKPKPVKEPPHKRSFAEQRIRDKQRKMEKRSRR